MVLHVFTSFLGGVPLCIPYGLYNGTSQGGTTWRTLGGYPSRVLSKMFLKIMLKFLVKTVVSFFFFFKKEPLGEIKSIDKITQLERTSAVRASTRKVGAFNQEDGLA